MSGRIIVFLSIVLIVISAFGLLAVRESAAPPPVSLLDISTITLQKDVKKGDEILEADILLNKRQVTVDFTKESFIIDKPLSFAIGQIATTDLPAHSTLRYSDIQQRHIFYDEISPRNGLLAFGFPLPAREFDIISGVKSGSSVDVYFRYEKSSGKESGIIAKSENIASNESANLSKLVLIFANRRVLSVRAFDADVKNPKAAKGAVQLEMSAEEIKKIYAIENLGHFYLFPASDAKSRAISTTDILPKDFIKELRGGN